MSERIPTGAAASRLLLQTLAPRKPIYSHEECEERRRLEKERDAKVTQYIDINALDPLDPVHLKINRRETPRTIEEEEDWEGEK